MRIVAVTGDSAGARAAAVEELVRLISARGGKVAVAVHRVMGASGDKSSPAVAFSRAGASRVLVTRGKEISFRERLAGLTPLRRVAARYFNNMDVVLGDGYLDPGERILVAAGSGKIPPELLHDPGLVAVVGEADGVPCFSPGALAGLADLLLKPG